MTLEKEMSAAYALLAKLPLEKLPAGAVKQAAYTVSNALREAELAAESRGAKARDAEWREAVNQYLNALTCHAGLSELAGASEPLHALMGNDAQRPPGSPSVLAAQPKDQANQGRAAAQAVEPQGETCACGTVMDLHAKIASHTTLDGVMHTTAGCAPGRPRAAPTPALPREAPEPLPIDMVLHCPNPKCRVQHVDAPEPGTDWTNPPHKSHKCHGCGTVWRPADVPTNGVAAIQTHGKADSWPAAGPSDPAREAPEPGGAQAEVTPQDVARLGRVYQLGCEALAAGGQIAETFRTAHAASEALRLLKLASDQPRAAPSDSAPATPSPEDTQTNTLRAGETPAPQPEDAP